MPRNTRFDRKGLKRKPSVIPSDRHSGWLRNLLKELALEDGRVWGHLYRPEVRWIPPAPRVKYERRKRGIRDEATRYNRFSKNR